MLMMSCGKNNVDFTWSPQSPRAGQLVTFSNTSESGEDWEWTFGDISTSTSKSPSKIYRKPGVYTVTLKVDGKSNWTKTHTITVCDTIPTILVTSDSIDSKQSIGIYREVTFTAGIYNPYSHKMSYQWELPAGTHYIPLQENYLGGDSTTGNTYHVLFTTPTPSQQITLRTQETYSVAGRDTIVNHVITRTVAIVDLPAEAIIMQTGKGENYRQRIFGDAGKYYQSAVPSSLASDADSLARAQDSVATYNGTRYTLSSLSMLSETPNGFWITAGKIYYRTNNGIYIANIDGTNQRAIAAGEAVSFICGDKLNNRIYWATADGVFYMPLIQSPNNAFTTLPVQINDIPNVVRLCPEYVKR